MKSLFTAFLLLLLISSTFLLQAQELPFRSAKISVAPELQESFTKGGRLLLHFSKQNLREPRQSSDITVGYTPTDWDGTQPFILDHNIKGILSIGAEKWTAPISGHCQEWSDEDVLNMIEAKAADK